MAIVHSKRILMLTLAVYVIVAAWANSVHAQRVEWKPIYRTSNTHFFDIDCSDPKHCVAVGNEGDVRSMYVVSEDGGLTWTDRTIEDGRVTPIFYNPAMPTAVSYPTPDLFVIGGDSGTVWVTSDRGQTIRRKKVDLDGRIEDIRMVDTRKGIACGLFGVFITTDCWETSVKLALPDSLDTFISTRVDVTPDGMMWAFVAKQRDKRVFIVGTTDKDTPWTVRAVPSGSHILDIAEDGFMSLCGNRIVDSVTEIKTSYVSVSRDSGLTWQTSLDTLAWPYLGLFRIAFANSLFGVTGGLGMSIWSTSDGGREWRKDTINDVAGPEQDFVGFRCFADGMCYAAMGGIVISQRPATIGTAEIRPMQRTNNEFSILPNPSNSHFVVRTGSQLPASARLEVVDILGSLQPVISRRADSPVSTEWRVEQQALVPGIYFVRISGSEQMEKLLIYR